MRPATFIFLFCVIETLSMVTLSTFPSLIPVFQGEWEISNAAAGWISGLFFAGFLIAVVLMTTLTDRIEPKGIFLGALALGFFASLGFALWADGTLSAGFWRLLQGLALGGTYMPGLKIMTDHLPGRAQSRGTAVYTATYYLAAGLSYFIALELEPRVGWSWTFGLTAVGPLLAFLLALVVVPKSPRAITAAQSLHLLDYRPVLANRRVVGYALLYGLHTMELIAFSSWLVPFLVYSQSFQAPGTPGLDFNLGTIAALVSIIALPASIGCNELAHRIGRQAVIIGVMVLSAVTGVALGGLATAPYLLVVALAFVYSATIAADSSTLTAGLVQVADPELKGRTMAVYSTVGFFGGFLGPIIFGVVLDIAGGETTPVAWIAAFATISALLLAGPLITWHLVGLRPIYR